MPLSQCLLTFSLLFTNAALAVNTGSFQSPSVHVRPKFRYWLPDASIDPVHLADDIKSIGSIGAGGIEFNNFYAYGGDFEANPVTDWDVYGFGTDAYNTILKAAAQATKDNNLIMDFALGPQSGQGVPAEINNPGLAYDLVSYNISIAPGQTYRGKIPGYGSPGTLVSVTTAMILNETSYSVPDIELGYLIGFNNYTVLYIAENSLTDITSSVRSDGSIEVKFPANVAGVGYIVYASYYELSGARACIPGQDPKNFIQNGSFAVDHFSARGAKVTTDFLEQFVLINGVKELLQEVGNYIWEDSVEVPSNLYWTPGLASVFQEMHGYDIGKYTMLLSYGNGLGFGTTYPLQIFSDNPVQAQGYIADYRDTLTYLLTTYYDHLVQWSREYLGLSFSGQIGYNLPVDMLEVIPSVDAPEDESLGFSDNIDAYKQYVGPANLAGKQVISNEMGAVELQTYQQTLPNLLISVKKAYSAGNNMIVFHGATYSFGYPNTTWPGYTSFGYIFSEQHSRHQPAWENGYSDMLNFVARCNFILQSGTPNRDVVFWDKQTVQNDSLPTLYAGVDLVNAGWGYEYLSPDNFQLPQAVVANKVLAPNGPAYKALIIRQTDLLTTDGVEKVATYAREGLPIIISGGIPTQIASTDNLSAAQAVLQSITNLPNVRQVTADSLIPALQSLGIQPLTKVSANDWYTYWRQDGQDSFIYLYNDGNYSSGTVAFASTKTPYFFDAWTGEQTPILAYTVASGYTTVPITLAPSQSMIVAFLSQPPSVLPKVHVTSAPSSVLGYSYNSSTGLVAKVPAATTSGTILTSDGKIQTIAKLNVSSAFALGNWTLIVEKWGPPADLTDIDTIAVKTNTTYTLPTLFSWPEIPGLQNTSGLGYYSTSFTWNDTSVGAIIDFGRVVHTLRAKINGHQLPPLDFTSAKADISQYLIKGMNVVDTVVATTMINGLVPILGQLKTAGIGPLIGASSFASTEVESGMVGTVVVTPYVGVKIAS